MQNKLSFHQSSASLEIIGLPDYSNNKNLRESLFDGEHVPFSKNRTYINMYLAFDVYYVSGKDVREFPHDHLLLSL